MGLPIPESTISDKLDNDWIIVQRQNSKGHWYSHRIKLEDFSANIGAAGEPTAVLQETINNDNYILTRSINNSGEFEIQLKYKVAYGSSFIVDLLPTQAAHCYFDRYIDVVISTTKESITDDGSWTTNRFYNNSTGVTNSLQGWRRSEGELLVNNRAFGVEVYNDASYQFIDLTNIAVSFGFTSSVSLGEKAEAWRIVTFRGVLIKDNFNN